MSTTNTTAALFVNITTPEGALSPVVANSNPEYGYVQVTCVSPDTIENGWIRDGEKRSAIIKGKVVSLERMLRNNPGGSKTLPGIIVISEFVYDNAFMTSADTERYAKDFDMDIEDLDERLGRSAKRAGKNGPMLTFEDQPIVRFADYVQTPTESDVDVLVQHDNQDEIREYRAEQKELAKAKK